MLINSRFQGRDLHFQLAFHRDPSGYRFDIGTDRGDIVRGCRLSLNDHQVNELNVKTDFIRRNNSWRHHQIRDYASQIGSTLYGALFGSEDHTPSIQEQILEECLTTVIQNKQHRWQWRNLSLVLDFHETLTSEISTLPWELLCRPGQGDPEYLAMKDHCDVLRTCGLQTANQVCRCRALPRPLRVLVVMPSPRWVPSWPIENDLGEPMYHHQRRLGDRIELAEFDRGVFLRHCSNVECDLGENAVKFVFLEDSVTEDRMADAIQHSRPDVLYYIGHGLYDAKSTQSFLALDQAERLGWAQMLPIGRLRDLIEGSTLKLVVLSSCYSGQTDEKKFLSGAVHALGQNEDLRAVIGMQFDVPSFCAADFDSTFVRSVASGHSINRSASSARAAMIRSQIRSDWNPLEFPDWANPVVFLRWHGEEDDTRDQMVRVEPSPEFRLGLSRNDRLELAGMGIELPEEVLAPAEERSFVGSAFYIGIWPVTNLEFLEFVLLMGEELDILPANWVRSGGRYGIEPRKGVLPVVRITRKDAERYCEWRGVRLPTADEWELAARGPTRELWPGGRLREDPWYWFDKPKNASPVSVYYSTGTSGFGVRDMAGNVYEWTSDSTDKSRGVILGGDWSGKPKHMLPSLRPQADPNKAYSNIGFRVARDGS